MKKAKIGGTVCSVCEIGKFAAEDATFTVERGHQLMLIESVPGFVCSACENTRFDEKLSLELTAMTESIFAKSHCHTFIFQFSDFMRPGKDAQEYEMFDRVRIQEGVDAWDLYDEDLEPGMEGTVLGKGEKPFDYAVEFILGSVRRFYNVVQVDIDRDDLELVSRVGEPLVKPKRKRSNRTAGGK